MTGVGADSQRDETAAQLRELERRIEVARELHQHRNWRGHPIQRLLWRRGSDMLGLYDEFCWTCRLEWPCPTVVALDGIVRPVADA